MSRHFFPMIRALAVPAAVGVAFQVIAAAPAMAQDPVKVDAKHYKVEFENDRVRVLRITYGPHEKSVMHSHPTSVAVFLTDGSVKFTLPDGKTLSSDFKAGMAQWEAGGKHLPENVSDKPFEAILVELKGKRAAAKAK
jgi:quercetin dioxygenase-like cupin family protein